VASGRQTCHLSRKADTHDQTPLFVSASVELRCGSRPRAPVTGFGSDRTMGPKLAAGALSVK